MDFVFGYQGEVPKGFVQIMASFVVGAAMGCSCGNG